MNELCTREFGVSMPDKSVGAHSSFVIAEGKLKIGFARLGGIFQQLSRPMTSEYGTQPLAVTGLTDHGCESLRNLQLPFYLIGRYIETNANSSQYN